MTSTTETESKGGFMSEPWTSSQMEMTKKDWAVLNTGGPVSIVKSGRDVVAAVWAEDDAEEQRFARLIAAAPDLLAALQAMLEEKADYMRRNNLGDPDQQHTNKMARVAIARATGAA